jgi:hypothetical protein
MADLATQYPSSPSFEAVNFRSNTPTQSTQTMSGKTRRLGLGVTFYSFEVKYPQLTRLQAGTVKGYLAQALGPQFSFEIVLPTISYSALDNQNATTPAVRTTMSQGATSVQLQNCGATKNVLAAGDFFKFNSGTKVYQCVAPCTSDASGFATLFFSGPAVVAVSAGTNLTITAVPFTCILADESQEWEAGIGGMTAMSVSMREVW